MELKNRLEILIQGATIAQKRGCLSFDDAVNAKQAIDNINLGVEVIDSVDTLIDIVNIGQENGAYNLKDAHLIYESIEGIFDVISNIINSQEQQDDKQEQNTENTEEVTENKKEE